MKPDRYIAELPRRAVLAAVMLLLSTVSMAQKYSGFNVLAHDQDSFGIIEIRQPGYRLINPLLDCASTTAPGLRTMAILEEQIRQYIASAESSGAASYVSVYYRDLSNGPWLGIDEEALYAPASLLKLPIFIAALKYAETHPDYLHREIIYQAPQDKIKEVIITGQFLQPGASYTVRQLLERMIIYSDNEAKNIISQTLPQQLIADIFFDLGIDLYKPTDPDNFMTVKEYAGFFRVLYNASYLNRDLSEYALRTLSQTAYQDGIVAGLPNDIPVAHKFGERTVPQDQSRQLHDCGIVYLNHRPYLLCIMTRGKDYQQLAGVISGISGIIYRILKDNT